VCREGFFFYIYIFNMILILFLFAAEYFPFTKFLSLNGQRPICGQGP
jgi:hypothetical protein